MLKVSTCCTKIYAQVRNFFFTMIDSKGLISCKDLCTGSILQ